MNIYIFVKLIIHNIIAIYIYNLAVLAVYYVLFENLYILQ